MAEDRITADVLIFSGSWNSNLAKKKIKIETCFPPSSGSAKFERECKQPTSTFNIEQTQILPVSAGANRKINMQSQQIKIRKPSSAASTEVPSWKWTPGNDEMYGEAEAMLSVLGSCL